MKVNIEISLCIICISIELKGCIVSDCLGWMCVIFRWARARRGSIAQPAQGVQHIAILERKKKKTFDRICCRPADDDDVSRAVYCPLSRQGDVLIILYFTEAFRPAGCSHTALKMLTVFDVM